MMTTSNEHNNAPAVPIQVNDAMAIAFHNALSDGPIDLDEMDDIKTGLNAALANVQAPAPTVPRGEAWGYVDHRGCAIKFKNARHRSELANAIECGGLEYLYTSPAEKLSNDIQSALESLVERCNHDAGMSNEDAVIHAEAVLEHVYNSRSTTPAPSPAVPDGPSHNQITHWARINNPGQAATPAPAPAQEAMQSFTVPDDLPGMWEHSDLTGGETDCAKPAQEPAGEAVAAALGDIIAMWDHHVPSEYVTPLHMQAKRALEGQQPVSPDMHGWCAYVGGMVAHWIRSEPDAFIQIGEERFEAAIAGIIERRLWAMPKDNKPTSAPKPAQEVGLTGCNCRWDGSEQVQWCELHLAHKDAIHEWAERAKTAEAKLDRLSSNQEVGLTDDQADAVSMSLRRAWQLGQTYWQQADSDYISQHKKSEETQRKFEKLCDDTIAALRAKGGK